MTSGGARTAALVVTTAVVCGMCACSHAQAPGDAARSAVSIPTAGVDQARWRTPLAAYVPERNMCIDRELARRMLNEFGDELGTTYPERAPQGVTTSADRYKYLLRRRPDIATSCTKVPDEME